MSKLEISFIKIKMFQMNFVEHPKWYVYNNIYKAKIKNYLRIS